MFSYKQASHPKRLLLLLLTFSQAYGIPVNGNDDINVYTYNAAVVEYHPIESMTMTNEEKLNYTVHDYIRLLDEITEDLDIILFPEASLTDYSVPLNPNEMTEVPEPYTENLCHSSNSQYHDFLKLLSCAAVRKNTTIVVNIVEKENCKLHPSPTTCPASGFLFYNCDVVLNEKGTLSAKYRKLHLIEEDGLTPAPQPQVIHFINKNNERFGIFTCFDIFHKKPALLLPKSGIRNILFPTWWFSGLPYTTALQVQQMWAQENNVTVLSSGANYPLTGTGGSGIFVGSKGPLNHTIVGKGGSKVMVHRIPKIEVPGNPYLDKIIPLEEDIDDIAEKLDDFVLKQDSPVYSGQVSKVLDMNESEIKQEVCADSKHTFCCHFHIKIKTEDHFNANKKTYTYHLAAFNGTQIFSEDQKLEIETCGVLACLNNSVNSCGKRFEKYSDIFWPVTFEYINVSAKFQLTDDKIQYPNSLLASLRPISPQYSVWTRDESEKTVRRDHILKTAQTKLLTFGIFGRDFSRDGHVSESEKLQSN